MITQKILSEKNTLKINVVLLVLCLAINLFLFRSLPDNIALQISSDGELANHIPKLLFVFFTPIVIGLITAYNKFRDELRISATIIPTSIMFLLNVVTLIINLM